MSVQLSSIEIFGTAHKKFYNISIAYVRWVVKSFFEKIEKFVNLEILPKEIIQTISFGRIRLSFVLFTNGDNIFIVPILDL